MKLVLKKHAFARLKELGDEAIAEIDRRLLAGETTAQVAAFIQEDLEKCTDIKLDSLAKTLERYRGSELRNRVMDRLANSAMGQANTATIQRRLNAQEQLEALVEIQQARFTKILGRETVIPGGILLKDVSREAVVLQSMLVDLGRIQLDTGVMQRAPKRVTGQITDRSGNIHEFAWTEEQDELYNELTQVLDVTDGS